MEKNELAVVTGSIAVGEARLPALRDLSNDQKVQEYFGKLLPLPGENPVREAIVAWFCDVCPSDHSRRGYARDMQAFIETLKASGKTPLTATADDVKYYKESLARAGYKKSTISRKLSVVRGMYEQLGKKGLVDWKTVGDVQAVSSPSVEKNTTPALSEQEAKKLLHAPLRKKKKAKETEEKIEEIKQPLALRDHALLFAYFKTACRSSALAYATVGDLERTESDFYLKVTEKGDKERRLALLEATPAILSWLEASGIDREKEKDAPLFPAMEKDKRTASRRHLTSRQILNIVKKYARQVGIQVERSGRGVGTHSLRKTALTNALQHGAKMEQVKSLAGHADIRTTQLYYQEGEKDAEDAARHIQIR